MNCPQCKLELKIGSAFASTQGGRPVMVQQMVCTNPKCPYGKANAPVRRVIQPLPEGEFGDAAKMCCDALLANITADSYFVAPGVDFSLTGGELRLRCPSCAKAYSFEVEGLAPLAEPE